MNLENQVCSLELSKKLKELGVEQKSVFYWEYYDDNCYMVKYFPYAVIPNNFNKCELYSAFTFDELFDLLPAWIDIKTDEPFNNFYLQLTKRTTENIKYIARYVCDSINGEELGNPLFQWPSVFKTHSPKLADCLANLLILIKKQGLS
jgi:hypothetical protein